MLILMLIAQLAHAGQVYVNGTLVNPAQIAGTTLEMVTVAFDAAGNVQVSAPGYEIEVMGPPASTPTLHSQDPPPPVSPSYPPVTGRPPVAAVVANPPPPAPGTHPSGVPKAAWWLATEDNGSVGHTIEVFVNGQRTHALRSGEPLRLVDIGGYLRPGTNEVLLRSNSVEAGGGTLYVYIGTGSDQSGTVVMDAPQVQFGLGPSRSGTTERTYSITVP